MSGTDGDVGGFYRADLDGQAHGHVTYDEITRVTVAAERRSLARSLAHIIASVNAEHDRYGFCIEGYYGA